MQAQEIPTELQSGEVYRLLSTGFMRAPDNIRRHWMEVTSSDDDRGSPRWVMEQHARSRERMILGWLIEEHWPGDLMEAEHTPLLTVLCVCFDRCLSKADASMGVLRLMQVPHEELRGLDHRYFPLRRWDVVPEPGDRMRWLDEQVSGLWSSHLAWADMPFLQVLAVILDRQRAVVKTAIRRHRIDPAWRTKLTATYAELVAI